MKRLLPPIGSPAYHVMLGAVALFILGPLGGISAAFMNFSIGFFVGGQVLAGILGSTVTLGYGPEGKHGANYIQTMSASVAGMAGMAVLLQAMVWLGLPERPAWTMILYLTCIGMLGVGVGMLYTPVLVDRMQLTYPSGYAVANILRALTDPNLLRRSIAKLGGGMLGGFLGGVAALKVPLVEQLGLSTSTLGAGMVVGIRIALPGLVVAVAGHLLKPVLVDAGWLKEGDPFRKIGFIIALGTILGAAMVDITLIFWQAAQRYRERRGAPVEAAEDWKRVNLFRLVAWVVFWAVALVVVGSSVLRQPVWFLTVAVGLVLLFVLVNGISLGISDWNPISSAFVMAVFLLAALGLKDPGTGLMCASVLLVACSVGGDMQQDRSTGWRLGTNRVVQFRYQVIGIAMGAVMAVVLAKVFMSAYPALRIDQFTNPDAPGVQQWQSAMTYKFVGALKGITNPQPHVMEALRLGIILGVLIEIARKRLKGNPGYQRFVTSTRAGRATGFVTESVILASPYASSFGGFVEIPTTIWFTLGGLVGELLDQIGARWRLTGRNQGEPVLPSDMSTTSLIGGGLIAGDSLAALSVGVISLLKTVL